MDIKIFLFFTLLSSLGFSSTMPTSQKLLSCKALKRKLSNPEELYEYRPTLVSKLLVGYDMRILVNMLADGQGHLCYESAEIRDLDELYVYIRQLSTQRLRKFNPRKICHAKSREDDLGNYSCEYKYAIVPFDVFDSLLTKKDPSESRKAKFRRARIYLEQFQFQEAFYRVGDPTPVYGTEESIEPIGDPNEKIRRKKPYGPVVFSEATFSYPVAIYGHQFDTKGVSFYVESGGCIYKPFFNVHVIQEKQPKLLLLMGPPKGSTTCESAVRGAYIRFGWEELGLKKGDLVHVANPTRDNYLLYRYSVPY